MKILDFETDFDFNDAKDTQRLENAIKDTQKELKNINTEGKKQSEIIRAVCNVIFNFYDNVFGENSSEKIFKGKQSLTLCLEAFEDTLKLKEEQDKKLSSRLKRFEEKYSE